MGLLPKDRDLNRPPEEVLLEVDASDFRVTKAELEVRLDHFLAQHLTWRSRTSIQALVKDRFVYVDAPTPDRPQGTGEWTLETRTGRKLRHGARVRIVIPEELRLPEPEGPLGELVVLYEDDDVLAVDKPAGVPVHPSGRHVNDTLIQRVHARYAGDVVRHDGQPRLAHRLDRETSGVVLIGRHPEAHRLLRGQFERGEVDKTYLAVVSGVPRKDAGSITAPIGPSRTSSIRLKMAVDEGGLPARTDWRVRERLARHALLECDLFTGRQHQIRVHLQHLGFPVVGDKLYGPDEQLFARAADGTLTTEDRARLELDRHALHHHRLALAHPRTGTRLVLESPLAPDLEAFLEGR